MLVAVAALVAAGCTPGSADDHRAGTPSGSPPGESRALAQPESPATRPDPVAVVSDTDVRLMGVRVRRAGEDYRIDTAWSPHDAHRPIVWVTARPGMPVGYRLISERTRQRLLQLPLTRMDRDCRPVGAGALCIDRRGRTARATRAVGRERGVAVDRLPVDLPEDLMLDPVASLDPDILAVVGGGDGATLFPFQQVSLSRDGGTTWQQRDLPRFDGAMAYSGGQVVFPDGRLLAALTHFSDDGPRRQGPAGRVHGLWVSSADDWSTFEPFRADGWPAAEPGTLVDGIEIGITPGRHPLVWAVVGSGTLYLSDDGGDSFVAMDLRAIATGQEPVAG